uniref:Variant surface glycoprotein 1154 n=1 Tax=Trypanosoma brucei TaxID=5691 RepID=M4SUQ4_9TRYP|nr:variant surface glycoprotein 1154 [Trypanosoma brucei]
MTRLPFAVFAFALVAITHIINPVAPTAKGALKVSVAKAFCTFVKTAKQAGNTLGTQLPKIKTAIESAEKARLQNELAAMKLPEHRVTALITAAYAAQALGSWTKTETDCLAQALFSAGAIDSFLRHLDQHRSTSTGDNKNCIGADGNGNYEAYNLDTKCADIEVAKATSGSTDVKATIEKGFGGIATTEAAGCDKECLLFDDVNTAYSNKANGLQYLKGLIKVSTTTDLTPAAPITTQKATNKLIKSIKANWKTTQAALHHLTIQAPTDLQTFKTLLAKASTRAALKAAATEYNNWKTDNLPGPIDSYLKKVYGIQADGQEGTYLTALKSLEATVRGGPGETTNKPIFSMTITELQEAIAAEIVTIDDRYAKMTKEIDTLRQTQAKKLSEDTCNKIKVEEECNATAACSFDKTETNANKKCKLDAKKATSNGVPVPRTQTAGATTTEKCKGKLEPDCIKAPDCKCEGTE